MALKVIGAGIGRTGTYSLKLAINRLGFGPCHHMEEVIFNLPVQVPLWAAAVGGRPDWPAIYKGYECAVDWPTAGFFRECDLSLGEVRAHDPLAGKLGRELLGDHLQAARSPGATADARLAADGDRRHRQDRISGRPR